MKRWKRTLSAFMLVTMLLTGNSPLAALAEEEHPEAVYEEPVSAASAPEEPAYVEPVFDEPALEETAPAAEEPVQAEPVAEEQAEPAVSVVEMPAAETGAVPAETELQAVAELSREPEPQRMLASAKGDTAFSQSLDGSFALVTVAGTHKKNQVPVFSAAAVKGTDTLTVLEAWTVSNIKNNTRLTMTAEITALPALAEGESLALYPVTGSALGAEPLAADPAVGDEVSLALAAKGPSGIAVVLVSEAQDEENTKPVDGAAIWANDDLWLTGKMPGSAVVDAQPVTVEIDGQQVLAAYDIKIYANANQQKKGKTWQPAGDKIQVHFRGDAFTGEMNVYHLADASAPAELVAVTEAEDGWVTFEAESFSVYAVSVTLEKTITASDGNTYTIQVSYNNEAGLPMEGTALTVSEILPDEAAYDGYITQAAVSAGLDSERIEFSRVFDIKIVDEQDNSRGYEPTGSVDVSISLAGRDLESYENLSVMHFVDDGAADGDSVYGMDAAISGETVRFTTDGFSVYSIVAGPTPFGRGEKVRDLAELEEAYADEATGANGFYLSYGVNNYCTNALNTNSAFIEKTSLAEASKWFFESAGEANVYYIYTFVGGEKKYMQNTSGNLMGLTPGAGKTAFVLSQAADEKFYFKVKDEDKWFQHSGGGKGMRLWGDNNNAGNSQITLTYVSPPQMTNDDYGLDGETYGFMNWNGGPSGRAMMAEADSLGAKALTVMSKKENNEDKLFVPKDSDISMWTFHWIENDLYYITAVVDESTKYLRLDAAGASLVSIPDDACRIKVVPGSGEHAGQICLKSGTSTLTYSGSVDTGFTVGGSAGSEWLYLVELSELTTDYFMTYSAEKVSVSDAGVSNGSHVVVYTRVWNDTSKKYEFYAVDHDGSLVPCYENGDSIQWLGGQFNTLLWDFVEYYWEGTTDPNYYYELYNEYSGKYMAPQITGGQILSDSTIGVNLNGRRNGQYQSTILAWDEANFAYTGLKADAVSGKIISCPIGEAEDFYFAVIQDIPVDDVMHTVQTVDHTKYGITMKMKNFGTRAEMSSFLGNDEGGAGTVLHQGLLSTDLGSNGYPTTAGGSLGTLFAGAQDVNHLFIESTYSGTGYYEFDSSQNFASLHGSDFVVYKELGSYDGGKKESLQHGQFFPFNDLMAGTFTAVNRENLYNAERVLLPDGDPRKHERLYNIEHGSNKADCYFAMELEASFTQTPNGHDAWGHDIIYQFTGDDDFWLYVDGELVIDLGGIHSAVPGSVNYATGQVSVNGRVTTLRDIFYNNYLNRDGHTAAEAEAYVNGIFELNSRGEYVFKEYSTHTMRIFYMERGAGASNLHMRFNLASIKPGHVFLSKELDGVDATESVLAEFPYQIWYKMPAPGGGEPTEHLLKQGDDALNITVRYKDTTRPVKYRNSLTVGGVTYENVFMLKPGEIADIAVPDNAIEYKIVECGVDASVYSSVSVKEGGALTKTASGTGRDDYALDYMETRNRPRVTYVNTVDPSALRTLTVTKKLYEEDGTTQISYADDDAAFSMRLYLATEFDEDLDAAAANMHTYHIKDENGNYCRWNAATQRFEKLGDDKTDYDALSAEEKAAASFSTSMNGAISKMSAFYTVEIRNVLAGTRFKVVERPGEIPDGYSFQKYKYKGVESTNAADGVTDIVAADADPHVDVCNLRGYGLRVNKVWTDADYMTDREPTYFAVYTVSDGALNLLSAPDSNGNAIVRQLPYGSSSLYWYFLTLPVSGTAFDQYEIREVKLTNPTVAADGSVTSYDAITPIEDRGKLSLSGKQKGEDVTSSFEYTVLYEKGTPNAHSNVRVDTVTNDRPGILLKKTTWNGAALAGAEFTLRDSRDNLIGAFTSGDDGVITLAFLRSGETYTLTETRAPRGYQGLESAMTLKMEGGNVTLGGVDSAYYSLSEDRAVLTIKNRPYTLRAVKQDRDTAAPLAGVHFALHRQVTVDGVTSIDLNPMPGFEDIVTGADGVLPGIDNTLPAGTYELREKAAPSGYQTLSGHIRFTVSPTGTVTMAMHAGAALTAEAEDADGTVAYTLTITNTRLLPAPTGVTMELAPYAVLLAAGLLLAILLATGRRARRDRT